MASTTARWWPTALARRVFSFIVSPNPPRVSRSREPGNMSTIRQVKGGESGKPYRRPPITSASIAIIPQDNKHYVIGHSMKNIEMRSIISDAIVGERRDKDACSSTSEIIHAKRVKGEQIVKHTDCKEDRRNTTEHQREEVVSNNERIFNYKGYAVEFALEESRHRDGSIYRNIMDTWWKKEYCITDRNETRLEAMSLSDPTDCIIDDDGTCMKHCPGFMLQFFSIQLDKLPVDGGLVELYGYIAARDDVDPLLNYVINFSRDDPIIVKQGSIIMANPKRGIDICDLALIEYDLRIKTGGEEKDDLQLIDGASIIGSVGTWNFAYTFCLLGDCGAVAITLARFEEAVEATVEVFISEVQNSFNLSLGCLTSGLNNKEIQLFHGAITESCGLKRSVVAVVINCLIDLMFKVGALPYSFEQLCSFKAKIHGHNTQEIKTDVALISVKVTWSTLPSWVVYE